eukprot:6311124-Prymnesium_polylepis.1
MVKHGTSLLSPLSALALLSPPGSSPPRLWRRVGCGWAAAGEGSGGGVATAATTAAVAMATGAVAVAKAGMRPMAARARGALAV